MGWLEKRRAEAESGEREFVTARAARIWQLSYLVPAVILLVVVVVALSVEIFLWIFG